MKPHVKHNINDISLGLFCYFIISSTIVLLSYLIPMFYILIKEPNPAIQNQMSEKLTNVLNTSGTPSIIAILIGACFLCLYTSRSYPIQKMFTNNCKMSKKSFVNILFVFLGFQLVFTLISACVETILNLFGLTAAAAIESATSVSSTISMFLYASIIGPIVEELVYRGFVMKGIQRNGKLFAILISSFFFGIMHGNLCQTPFAFSVGLILAYTAIEYSIWWAIALHIINNCIYSDLLSYALSYLPESWNTGISYGIQLFFLLGAMFVIFKNKAKIVEYIKANRTPKHTYSFTVTSFWFIIYSISQLALVIFSVTKL